MSEEKKVDIQMNIWRGQALNMAWQEAIAGGKIPNLEAVFKRAKEIFEEAYKVGFFEWGLDNKSQKEGIKFPTAKSPLGDIKDPETIRLEHLGTLESDISQWKGAMKECPVCGEQIPAYLPVHEYRKNWEICGAVFHPLWNPPPGPDDKYKLCRRCGEKIPVSWKKHTYKKDKSPCGYEFVGDVKPAQVIFVEQKLAKEQEKLNSEMEKHKGQLVGNKSQKRSKGYIL
jgi:hypothetical protein